jgi:hypothetical protein
MSANRRKVFGILAAVVLVSVGAGVAAINFGTCAKASSGDRALPQTGWRLGSPVTYQNLTIFPVVAAQDVDTSEFATLDEALASGDALVTEQGSYMRRTRDGSIPPSFSSGPQVNQLVLINRGKRPLILLAGEIVSGGKQDRVIGKDRIVPAGSAPLPLDVFCVEHGRWTPGAEQFSAAQVMVYPTVRDKAAIEQDQKQVWAAVRGEAAPVGASSESEVVDSAVAGNGHGSGIGNGVALSAPPQISRAAVAGAIEASGTQSYQKIYQASPIGTSVETFAEEIQRRFDRATSNLKGERVVGVVVAFGAEPAWSDIFASSQLFDSYWPKLLRSYVVEAMTRPGIPRLASLDAARDFLRPATGHIEEESEPGIYRWRKQSEGRLAEIDLDALAPKTLTLHWLRVLHGNASARFGIVE